MPETVRRSRWILAPLIIVLALAAAWSGFWFYAAQAADGMMAAWIDREAKVGRIYTCASRQVGGYPFRIEARCSDPVVELQGGPAPVIIKAREILAVAQIYQPNLLIAEVKGPMTVMEQGETAQLSADWSLMQVSVRGRPGAPERVSLVVQAPRLDRGLAAAAQPVVRADRLEFHVRRQPAATAAEPVFDIAASARAAMIPAVPLLAHSATNIDATGVLRGLADLRPMPLTERLKAWQAAGGRLEITGVRVQQGEGVAVAKGEVGLTASGRLDGGMTITAAGFDDFARMLGLSQGAQGGRQTGILAGLAMLGGSVELEGKRAISMPLRLRDGAIFVGPIPFGQIGPFF